MFVLTQMHKVKLKIHEAFMSQKEADESWLMNVQTWLV